MIADDLGAGDAAARHERRPAVAEQALERIAAVGGVTGGDQRVGDVRPADAPAAAVAPRPRSAVDVDGIAELARAASAISSPAAADRPLPAQERRQRRRRRGSKK